MSTANPVRERSAQIAASLASEQPVTVWDAAAGQATEVTEEVPDPDAPKVRVTRVVEDVEWDCGSLLRPVADGAVPDLAYAQSARNSQEAVTWE